jgi:serine/threonine protein kinase/tetratricopeptide (TPR) repeat protein
MPSNINVDRNLLFAVIALQDDLIDQTQFADVCAGWAMRLERPLSDLLMERGWITEADRNDVERKLERKLKKNQGDVRATLGSVADIEVREVLQEIKATQVQQSIHALAPARGHVLVETLVPRASQRDSLRYTLTRLHAEGGLGKIWIAHDTDLNREVALKEIKSSTAPNPEAWRRFLKEAQITGQLEHPNIVPVYELARRKEDDQPFYTMRFLRGQSLRDAIAEFHRRRAGKPANRLELQRQLLEPFVKVCQAVGYAHARGVIHRDLKPENVVLGGHGEVVVLDWGLAKVVGERDDDERNAREPRVAVSIEAETKPTIGQVGTPVYMAPEQVEADNSAIDSRTDVYGLGAILFEILTAHPPVSGSTVGEVFSKIQAGNLHRARELEPTVPRALEAICARALEHDRSNRYRRAEDLAEDVRRWIVDEPVSVYRDPIAVRVLRWGRHHRTLATTLAALVMTTVIGLSVGVALIERERGRTEKQRSIAEGQRKIATANAARALHNLRLAQDAADGLLGEVADVDLADIPQMEPVRQRLLEKAQAGYQQFLVQEGDDPLIRWGAGRSQVRLGEIQALLGDIPKAEASYRQAAAELEKLSKNDPANADFRRDLARSLQGLGVLLKDANRFQEGEARLREAIRLREEIAKQQDSSAFDRQGLADARYQLGALLARRGAAGPADVEAYRAALEVQQALVKQYGDRPEYRTRLARYRNNLAILQNVLGKPRDSEATLRDTLELLAPLVKVQEPLPAARWQFARASNNLGSLLLKGRPGEASTLLRDAQGLLSKLAAEFPAVTQYPLELASVEYNQGLLAAITGHPPDAISSYKESVRILESLKRRFPAIPAYRMKLAVSNVALSDAFAGTTPDEAEACLKKALDEQSILLAEYPGVPEYQRTVGRGHYQLSLLLVRSKPTDAVLEAEKAKALHQQVLLTEPDSELDQRFVMEDQILLSQALIAAGRLSEAMAAAEQLPSIRPADPRFYVHGVGLLIRCALAVKDTPEGRKSAEDCLARAVGMLRDAVRAKVIRSGATLDAPDFDRLRDRDDFKALRNSVDEAAHVG